MARGGFPGAGAGVADGESQRHAAVAELAPCGARVAGHDGRLPAGRSATHSVRLLGHHGDLADTAAVRVDHLAARHRAGRGQRAGRRAGRADRPGRAHPAGNFAGGVSPDCRHHGFAPRQLQPARAVHDARFRAGGRLCGARQRDGVCGQPPGQQCARLRAGLAGHVLPVARPRSGRPGPASGESRVGQPEIPAGRAGGRWKMG